MFDKELRKTIGSRTKMRRKELNLKQEYLAEKLDVNKSTIQRYESGTIDNTKKLVVEGLANALHVSQEWLTGKTDDLTTEVSSKIHIEVLDALESTKLVYPASADEIGKEFAQTVLLLFLKEYEEFNKSLDSAYKHYHHNQNYDEIAEQIGFTSADELSQVMFSREITHTANTLSELAALIEDYPKDHESALLRLKRLLEFYT